MEYKRIIPCLDILKGRVVKGVQFVELKDVGDPVECAAFYVAQGADELAFLDITATTDERDILADLVEKVARNVSVPFTVGGGIRTAEDFERILRAGADKISVGTAAVMNPNLIAEAARQFGRQRVVTAIDVKALPDGAYHVCVRGGREDTGLDAVDWAKRMEDLGAGEILLTSMDRDGEKSGYDLEITAKISGAVGIPVTASGGAGAFVHFKEALTIGGAGAALAASLFHFRELTIPDVKRYLQAEGVPVRL